MEACVRPWGRWEVVRDYPGVKVKELFVEPGLSLSDQRHIGRDEFWFIVAGEGVVKLGEPPADLPLMPGRGVRIPRGTWHLLTNTGPKVLHIVEVQRGVCVEADIERRD